MSLNPTNEVCARCGNVAEGHAFINDKRYCHGDNQATSCYELAQWEESKTFDLGHLSEKELEELLKLFKKEGH